MPVLKMLVNEPSLQLYPGDGGGAVEGNQTQQHPLPAQQKHWMSESVMSKFLGFFWSGKQNIPWTLV